MSYRVTSLVTALALVLGFASASGEQAQRMTLDAVLSAYVGGDHDIVRRTFVRSPDIQARLRLDRPRELDRWLGSWNSGKALLLLEFARTSTTVAPQFVLVIANVGARYIAASRDAAVPPPAEFVRVWHRAAVGMMLGASEMSRVEEYVAAAPTDGRLLLARGVAQERRCWTDRPMLEQQGSQIDELLAKAGVRVPDDPDGPFSSAREALAVRHRDCVRESLLRLAAAADTPEAATEARVRAGWSLIQDGRPAEAAALLDTVKPQGDPVLEYWHALFRGRALDAAGSPDLAEPAYRAALALYPRAQSAGIGLSIALMRLDRRAEADEVGRSIREAGPLTPDPWLQYPLGDERFAGRWVESLRTSIR